MIQVQHITFSHAGTPLYEGASFSVPKRKKAGLVGLNGAGKSTLFQLLLGNHWPDEGRVRVEGSVGYVPQEVSQDPIQQQAGSVRDYLRLSSPLPDHRLRELMDRIELPHLDLDALPRSLSGGQKTKLALLFTLLKKPDVLLLDEPTNFMDQAGKKWVMNWLAGYQSTLMIVSHDLDLLDRHIDKIIYINTQTKLFEEYTGTYSKFKKLKADKDAHLTRYIKNQQRSLKRLEKSVERLKQSSAEKVVRQRVILERRIARIEESLPPLPQEIVRIKLQLPEPAHLGELPVSVSHLTKAYSHTKVLSDCSLSIRKGERVALIGKNGAGKSTLLKAILGLVPVDGGEIKLDPHLFPGYYSQELEILDGSKSLFETLIEQGTMSEGQVRAFLAKFMFGADTLKQRVGSLSGGEKTRLSIALLMQQPYNLLVLDEPTTYLDGLSQRIILEALKVYRGTMVVVSHTPEFLLGLKPHKALLLPDERFLYWDDTFAHQARES